MTMTEPELRTPVQPPRDDLFRSADFELRQDADDAEPVLYGHFAVFNRWAEIDSFFEGRFLERIAPGAFKKTFQENRTNIRVLFQHGFDPQIGDQVLGNIRELREDRTGAYYEVLLFEGIPPLILNGLRNGSYGASFRFRVIKEEFVREPETSDYNPEGLPERTILELQLQEFGPVTFPAYEGATAQARSLTDEMRSKREPARPTPEKAGEPEVSTPEPEPVRATPPKVTSTDVKEAQMSEQFHSVEEIEARMADVVTELEQIETRSEGELLSAEDQATWDSRSKLYEELEERAAAWRKRQKRLTELKSRSENIVTGGKVEYGPEDETPVREDRSVRKTNGSFPVRNIHDLREYRSASSSREREEELIKEGARRIVERSTFPEFVDETKTRSRINRLLDTIDNPDPELDPQGVKGVIARRIIQTGSQTYRRAFAKIMTMQYPDPDEMRALSLTGSAGGFAVPFALDPTILNTSNGVVNPIRQLARVIQITGDTWKGVTSTGITATYEAEATETTDNAPTLVQPEISTEKAQAFVPYSIEVGQDWSGMENDIAELLADSKDTLEAAKFISGTGTNEPFGVAVGTTTTVNAAAGADAFTLANLYTLMGALPPRYRPRGAWVGDLALLNRIRQFETAGGSTSAVWVDGLQADTPGRLLGKPAYEASEMPNDATTGNKFLIFGDFSRYVIVERVGLNIENIPHLMGANRRPTGQRGLYAYWRNGAKVVDANAFRALLGTA
jgi:HK97 family phage major capsid protein/HK97 family phage prohead protease